MRNHVNRHAETCGHGKSMWKCNSQSIIAFSIQFLFGIKEYLRLAHAAHELFFCAPELVLFSAWLEAEQTAVCNEEKWKMTPSTIYDHLLIFAFWSSFFFQKKKTSLSYPRDPGSPNLRMVMEPKWPMRFEGDWTPQSSAENMTGCLGLHTYVPT